MANIFGTVTSCSSSRGSKSNAPATVGDWIVHFTYTVYATGNQSAPIQIIIGSSGDAVIRSWANAQSVVTIPSSLTPQTVNTVQLPCPSIVAAGLGDRAFVPIRPVGG